MDPQEMKERAAALAVEEVRSGMTLGLGAGSTALAAIRMIGERLGDGTLTDVVGVPCSEQVAADARASGIPLIDLDETTVIELTIDGADEMDSALRLIKGGGGALLREKIVAQSSRREIIIIDESKYSERLGTLWALPLEVIPFGWRTHVPFLEALGAMQVKLRKESDGACFYTDGGNLILDANFGPMVAPEALAQALSERAGIIEHGLFLGLASEAIIAYADGRIERIGGRG